ncbi:trimethylamine N-oxide reductase system protein TorE [Enterovibrio norvegicus FF-33]|uniref:trimethylamine N-oxide reductase system protein TorE n=1 Tax=Enterovibrio TaxID=188143 RepID=UPI0003007523|nr:trimethylamine N-oxide reductase system protein TorE [Enterovibrio norvegicus]OEE66233.1 trimethylamine N-oxide reductase system protein TorE [Enterovibrio norvegicus FF-33]
MEHSENNIVQEPEKRSFEWRAFCFIAIFLFPILSVVLIGGYGFLIWMSQIFLFGPPGHG